jgi:hypothetical protein
VLGGDVKTFRWRLYVESMTAPQSNANLARNPRQFKIASLFLLIGIVASILGVVRYEYERRREREVAAAPWKKLGAEVTFGHHTRIIGLKFGPGSSSKVSDDHLAEISKLPHLVDLDFGGYLGGRSNITGAGITRLKNLSELQSLNLDGTAVTASGLAELKNLSQLQFLFLGSTGITGPDLVHLEGRSNLRGLWLNHTKINDADLVHLKKHLEGLVHLEVLHLAATDITDAGLVHLEEMARLDVLRVNGPGVSIDAMRALQKKLPNTEIWD